MEPIALPEQENSMASTDSGVVGDLANGCSSIDDEDSCSSSDVLTNDVIEEEAELSKKSLALLEKERRIMERKRDDAALRDQSKKRLVNVLQKSQFYVSYMKSRMEEQQNETKPVTKSGGSRKRKLNDNMYSKEVTEILKKSKESEKENESHVDSNKEETNKSSIQIKSQATKITPMGIKVNEDQPQLLEGIALRDYQLEGFKWLKGLFEGGMNGILADEMGLGKTVQTISLICHLYTQGVQGPFLIVGPLSTLPNWMHEIQTFAPKIPVVLYHGTKEHRREVFKSLSRKYKLFGKRVMPVVVTSFEVTLFDENLLRDLTWKYIIVDEGHRLKNYQSNLSKCLIGFRSINRLILSGTPIQNDLKELWSLLYFILPEIFDDIDIFETLFTVEEIQNENESRGAIEKGDKLDMLTLLHSILTPFLLRRLKGDVNVVIPSKKEILVHCPMSKIQLELYTAVLDKSIMLQNESKEPLNSETPNTARLKRFSKLRDPKECAQPTVRDSREIICHNGDSTYKLILTTRMPFIPLLQITNHPYLIQPKVYPGSNFLLADQELIESSGKMSVMHALLERLKERQHRVLIFSTSTAMLDLIELYANMVGHTFRRLDGNTKIDERRQYMKEYNTDPSIFMFLLSTRAGGLGINLTGADTVIIYNSDWNPQADLQAQDRCHRLGQTKPVVVYRLMATGTYDERVIERASAKRKLERLVIGKGKFKHGSSGQSEAMLNLQELADLLNEKRSKFEVQPNGTLFSDKQWEELLNRKDTSKAEE